MKQNAFDALQRGGIVTKTMLTDEFESLSSKLYGEDGANLVRGRDFSPDEKASLFALVNDRLDAGITFNSSDVSIAEKQLKESLVTDLERLQSSSLENQLISYSMMYASANNATEQSRIRDVMENLIMTGDPSLTSQQEATLDIQATNAAASDKNARANLMTQMRLLEKQRTDAANEAERKRIEDQITSLQAFQEYTQGEFGANRDKNFSEYAAMFAQFDYTGGERNRENEFANTLRDLNTQIAQFVDYDARGRPSGLLAPAAFRLAMERKDELISFYIQGKAKQSGFFDNDFRTQYQPTTLKNIRFNNDDPRKATKIFFVDANNRRQGEVSLAELGIQPEVRQYLVENELRRNLISGSD
jgi:hypothetical protein